MYDLKLWQFIADRLAAGETAALLVVVDADHETPGKPGFKLAVATDGELRGTIGGGALEHELVETARRMLADGETRTQLVRRVLRDTDDPEAGDMICGGNVSVAVVPLHPGRMSVIASIAAHWRERRPGRFSLSPDGIAFAPKGAAHRDPAFRRTTADTWHYEERLGTTDTVYIVGGGHVGLALSRVLAILDLRIVVLDERPDVGTMRDNTSAHAKLTVPFSETGKHIPDGNDVYVIIATPGHRADETVLRQLARRDLRYVGMMGSRNKVREIMSHLRADGFDEATLARVHSPIGLPIHSHTAGEIAVSIAAELVQVRNRPES